MRRLLISWPPWMPSIAHGDLETSSQDLPQLLGRPATPLTEDMRRDLDELRPMPLTGGPAGVAERRRRSGDRWPSRSYLSGVVQGRQAVLAAR